MPFGIHTVEVLEYELCEVERDGVRATELAYEQLAERMVSEVPEGTVVRKQTVTELCEDGVLLRCRAEFIENIAITKEIEIEGFSHQTGENEREVWKKKLQEP